VLDNVIVFHGPVFDQPVVAFMGSAGLRFLWTLHFHRKFSYVFLGTAVAGPLAVLVRVPGLRTLGCDSASGFCQQIPSAEKDEKRAPEQTKLGGFRLHPEGAQHEQPQQIAHPQHLLRGLNLFPDPQMQTSY
jgi:hypothetical protein